MILLKNSLSHARWPPLDLPPLPQYNEARLREQGETPVGAFEQDCRWGAAGRGRAGLVLGRQAQGLAAG